MVQAAGRRLLSVWNLFQEVSISSILRSEPQWGVSYNFFLEGGEKILDTTLVYMIMYICRVDIE